MANTMIIPTGFTNEQVQNYIRRKRDIPKIKTEQKEVREPNKPVRHIPEDMTGKDLRRLKKKERKRKKVVITKNAGTGYPVWNRVGGSENSICLKKGDYTAWVYGRKNVSEKLILELDKLLNQKKYENEY